MRQAAYVAAVAFAVAIYAAPVARLWEATGRSIPPWVSADTYLYLNLARVTPDREGMLENPWYGHRVPAQQVSYLRFGLPYRAFRALAVLTGSEGAALVAWHALLALTTAVAILWMLRGVTSDPVYLLAAFAALVTVDAAYVWADISQMRSGTFRWVYGLPFSRTFYPQAGVPLVFTAIGALVRWLTDRWTGWLVLIVILQFLAFVSFPYAAIVTLGGLIGALAAAAALGAIARRELRTAMLATISSGLADALWLLGGRGVHLAGSEGLLRIDASQLVVSRTITLPLVLGGVAIASRAAGVPARAAFGGFAVAFALVQFADLVLTPALLFGTHIAYFYTIAFWLPLVAAGLALTARLPLKLSRLVATAGVAAMLGFGVLEARATTRAWTPYNSENGELARALATLALTPRDLVALPTHGFRSAHHKYYWEASWVPLVSAARVLYSAHGKLLLPADSADEGQRLAAYLFLRGETRESLGAILAAAPGLGEQAFLVGYGRELFLMSSARQQTLDAVAGELGPELEALARGERPEFLLAAERVIVADYRDDPELSADRVHRLVAVHHVAELGAWRVLVGRPRR